MKATTSHNTKKKQKGVAIVEFAFIAIVFFGILIAIMEMGRVLFTWNAATEATRWGARLAVVCDKNDGDIIAKMQQIMPSLQSTNVTIDYYNPPNTVNSCDKSNCKSVTVSINNYAITPIFPFWDVGTITLPPFQTSLPRESMDSASETNPVCT